MEYGLGGFEELGMVKFHCKIFTGLGMQFFLLWTARNIEPIICALILFICIDDSFSVADVESATFNVYHMYHNSVDNWEAGRTKDKGWGSIHCGGEGYGTTRNMLSLS